MNVSVKVTGSAFKELESQAKRFSPKHLAYINRVIVAPIIHAEITANFEKEGRPKKWAPLRKIYAKVKAQTQFAKPRYPNKQPQVLGKYPTPWGNIGVRYGKLYNSLGNVLQITDRQVIYGVDVPYADKFSKGFTVNRIVRDYATKKGFVTHYHDLKRPIKVPARPFEYVSFIADDAIGEAIEAYLTAPLGRKQIVIPAFNRRMLSPGGRNIRILYS